MKINTLIRHLKKMDGRKSAFVFDSDNKICKEIESVCENGGAQINLFDDAQPEKRLLFGRRQIELLKIVVEQEINSFGNKECFLCQEYIHILKHLEQ